MVLTFDDDFLAVPVKKGETAVQVVKLTGGSHNGPSVEERANAIVASSGWRETDPGLRKRLLEIVVSHLKDIRDEFETKAQLAQPREKGGLGMSPAEIQGVMEAVNMKPVASAEGGSASGGSSQYASSQGTKPVAPPPAVQSGGKSIPSVPITPQKPDTNPQIPPPAPSIREKLQQAGAMLTKAIPPKPAAPVPVASSQSGEGETPPKPVASPPAAPERSSGGRGSQSPVAGAPSPATPTVPTPVSPAPSPSPQPPAPKGDRPPPLPASRDEAVSLLTNDVMRELAFRFPDPYTEDRLRNAVGARLRDIRDWLETEETLKRAFPTGGVGLTSDQIVRVHDVLEPRVVRIHEELFSKQKGDVVAALGKEKERDQMRVDRRKLEEQSVIDRRYEELTGKTAADTSPVVGRLSSVGSASPTVPTPPPPRAPIFPVQAPIPQPSRPTMTDIQPAARLVGPIDELRRLTVADFRKLSADPAEAVRKIQDKIRILEEESLPKRLEGVAALKESEVFRAYLAAMRASFEGVSLEEALAGLPAQRLPALSKQEFDAIMELNRGLRY